MERLKTINLSLMILLRYRIGEVMRKIFTTISKNYVPDWGLNEGVREIVQNALDANDAGYKAGITYVRKRRTLTIYNTGARLVLNNLLLGSTSKEHDKKQRGQYGEGFKIGSLALIRAGHDVTIHNGKERIDCGIEKHPDFQEDVLTFNIVATGGKHGDKLLYEIKGIEPEDWKAMQINFLSIYGVDKETKMSGPNGTVLMDQKLKGRIYCGGIYVTTDKEMKKGYNFTPGILSLNRDRNMANSFEVRWESSKLWAYLTANKKGKLYDTTKMLKEGWPDVQHMKEFSDYTLTGQIVDKFFAENNSNKAYPVTNEKEAKEVSNMGYSPIYSSETYTSTLRSKLGSIEDLKRQVEMDYSIFKQVTPIDDANMQWVFEVMYSIDPRFDFRMAIVKFVIDETRSIVENKTLMINHNLLTKKYDILYEVIQHYCSRKDLSQGQVWKQLYQKTCEGIK